MLYGRLETRAAAFGPRLPFIMAYTKQQLEQARRDTIEAKKVAGKSARVGKSGRMTMQVDQRAYFNAIERNGGVDADGNHIWNADPSFRKDMMKRHPESVVEADKAGNSIGPFIGPSAENFKRIFGDSELDHVVVLEDVDPFAHIKVK